MQETDELNKKIKKINALADQRENQQKAFMKDINNQQATGKELSGLPVMKPGKPIKLEAILQSLEIY